MTRNRRRRRRHACSNRETISYLYTYIGHLPIHGISFYEYIHSKHSILSLWVRSLMSSPLVNDINVPYSRNALNNTVIITLCRGEPLLLRCCILHYTASRRPYALHPTRSTHVRDIATTTALTVAIAYNHYTHRLA